MKKYIIYYISLLLLTTSCSLELPDDKSSVLAPTLIPTVFVEGGTFQMGSTTGDPAEQPVHSVTLSSFAIGKYEVTQAQWKTVMGVNPSIFSNCDDCPVEKVSWNDIQLFITRLNTLAGKIYRLPTEAEWEYAARGGKLSKGYTYSGSNTMDDVAWYYSNSSAKPHSVGQKMPNELGIYDMSGNVFEWCSDQYGAYSSSSQTNPTGASSGTNRVSRGGSWADYPQYSRVAFRIDFTPDYRNSNLGFRVVTSQ
ncbi:formylglycine-generating enzyme family protein [Flectobacillus roseus]